MDGVNYMSLYKKYQLKNLVGLDDWVDRLSYTYSFIILLGFTILVTSKTYMFRPIACHMPTAPQGANFKDYVESACWVLGTVPIRANESMPQNSQELAQLSADRKIGYYQWVPFILGLQCVLFYMPRLAWQALSFNRLGTDLNSLISTAHQSLSASSDEQRANSIEQVARSMELLLFAHRDYRHGLAEEMRRALAQRLGPCFVSKRFGTWIVFCYLFIKLTYLGNTVFQLYLMKIFLSYSRSLFGFGMQLFRTLIDESDWSDTLYFPRKASCTVSIRHLGATENIYTGVCALPINMLNEKVYIFLYFWTSIVMVLTAASIPLWLTRICIQHQRTALVYKYLSVYPPDMSEIETSGHESSGFRHSIDPTVRTNVDRFVDEFLRADGIFLLHILTMNVGDLVTAEIVSLLWKAWVIRYANRLSHEQSSESDIDYEGDHATPEVELRTGSGSLLSEETPELRMRRKSKLDHH